MLNLKAKNTYHYFDKYGMMLVKRDELSWKDSLGRTVLAWIAYGKPKELRLAVKNCWKLPSKKWRLIRHPNHSEEASRDHYSYAIIMDVLYCGRALIYGLPSMRGMNLWMKSLTGNKWAERAYYLIYIPGARIGNSWLKFCRRAGGIKSELTNKLWIAGGNPNYGTEMLYRRTKWQKLWAWIIFQTIPAYSLHNKAWQIYVMPDSKKKEKLKRILLKRVAPRNLLLRLLLGDDTVTQEEVDNYPHMTGYRPGVYLDETCRRTIRKMTEQESEFNNYEVELIKWLWLEGFPCKNCANKDEGHEDYCEFAWDDYNYGKTIWDCLGSK